MNFSLIKPDPSTQARLGMLTLPRGTVQTPAFMPVGTLASVKGLTPAQVRETGAEIILANTYHLMLRPGAELVASFGGVANFMAWRAPLLTDSGGFQVFSLQNQRKLTPEGVEFRSHIDGSTHFLSPERAVDIQHCLNSDIMMALDICPAIDCSRTELEETLKLTHDWARRCVEHKGRADKAGVAESFCSETEAGGRILALREQSLFPIIQGGLHLDLRSESAETLRQLDAPGYAIGGVSVGEGHEEMERVVRHTAPLLPWEKPRYLMGVGHPADLLMGVAAGIDMFDCVLPTRNGRNGGVFTADGPLNLRNATHRTSRLPIDPECDCYACRNFSRSYLRHLFIAGEMLASELASVHNIRFLLRLMEKSREHIANGGFAAFAREASERYLRGERERKGLEESDKVF